MIRALVVLAFSWAKLSAPPWPEERGLKAEFSLENLEKMDTFSIYQKAQSYIFLNEIT